MKDVRTCDKPRGVGNGTVILGFPNGATQPLRRLPAPECIGCMERTRGTDTSQYPEEKKANAIPSVVASESGTAQIPIRREVRTPTWRFGSSVNILESSTKEGDSPVSDVKKA